MSENNEMGVRAGSREPSQQAVSAVPASIPDAQTVEEIVALLRDFPANGKPPGSPALGWAMHFGFIEEREITKPCRECGRARPDYYYRKLTAAGKAVLSIAQGMAARSGETGTGSTEGNSPVAEGHAPEPHPETEHESE